MSDMVAAPAAPSATKNEQSKYDIRNGFRFDLLNPDTILPQKSENSGPLPQEKLIAQLEKQDLIFDVSEVLNPF